MKQHVLALLLLPTLINAAAAPADMTDVELHASLIEHGKKLQHAMDEFVTKAERETEIPVQQCVTILSSALVVLPKVLLPIIAEYGTPRLQPEPTIKDIFDRVWVPPFTTKIVDLKKKSGQLRSSFIDLGVNLFLERHVTGLEERLISHAQKIAFSQPSNSGSNPRHLALCSNDIVGMQQAARRLAVKISSAQPSQTATAAKS